MDYKVLYRKYRPQNFNDIVGQDHIVTILKNSIESEKLSHSYIFSGPRGTGKTSTAKIFAKTINCLSLEESLPCEKCKACLNSETSPDIIELDAASNNGVDEVREINENVKLLPVEMKYKVYIIDEVHMLTRSAFNALLKTLEEPPSHVIFILATTNVESIPATILSRSQRFDFLKIDEKTIYSTIKKIAKLEKISTEDEALKEISFISDGGLRDALSILDQASKGEKVTTSYIENMLGTTSLLVSKKLLNAYLSQDSKEIIKIIDKFEKTAADYKIIIKNLINVITEEILKTTNKLKLKKLALDLVTILNKSNININMYDMLKIIFITNLEQEVFANLPINEKKTIESKITTKTKQEVEKKLDTNVEKIIDIRINNCFVDAAIESKEKHNQYWEQFLKKAPNDIKGVLLDTEVSAASDSVVIIKTNIDYNIAELKEKLFRINEDYKKLSQTSAKITFVTTSRWLKEVEEFKKNRQNKKEYHIIEEPENNELKKIANGIFDDIKIKEEK